jgi:hypothetical protein
MLQIVHRFRFEPFASMTQPIIEEVLAEHKKEKYRKGTILTPIPTTYLVFALAIRRDLNYHQTLNWLISGFRWKSLDLPAPPRSSRKKRFTLMSVCIDATLSPAIAGALFHLPLTFRGVMKRTRGS